MKRQSILLVGLTVAILLLVFGTPLAIEVERTPLSWHQASAVDGERLYGSLCAPCHGVDARGAGPAAPALDVPVPDLTLLAASNEGTFPERRLRRSIAGPSFAPSHRARVMPAWREAFEAVRPDWKPARREAFARERIDAVIRHLETLQEQTPTRSEG